MASTSCCVTACFWLSGRQRDSQEIDDSHQAEIYWNSQRKTRTASLAERDVDDREKEVCALKVQEQSHWETI